MPLKGLFFLFKTAKDNPFYSFIFLALVTISFYNYADANGRVFLFDNYTQDEVFQKNKNALIANLSSNKDFISLLDSSFTNSKGGIDEPEQTPSQEYYLEGNSAIIQQNYILTTNASKNNRTEVLYYTVKKGDTVSKIAAEFGITINTILWANNLSKTSYIKEGQKLKILPVTGVQHDVKKGDTLIAIARRYKAKVDDIIKYNGLPADGSLQVGETLIIPDGEMPVIRKATRYVKRNYPKYSSANRNISKNFGFPTRGIRSQGLHRFNAVDIANRCGTPIWAVMDGVVISAKTTKSRARFGWSVYGGYGNYIKIKHSNGVVTLYAHLKNVLVKEGQYVKKGQRIATMGGGFEYINGRLYRMQGAGNSTGCHVHFEVRGASNPMAKYWKY